QADFKASYSTILLAPTGERTVLNYVGSLPKKHTPPFNLEIVAQHDWLYLSSLNDMELLDTIATKAAASGTKIAMNPSGLELSEPRKLKPILEDVTVLLVNKEEAQELVEGETLEELVYRLAKYCPVVIISDGPNGVLATDGKTLVRAGMYEDVPVLDRTGAGDAFGSGFVSQWAIGKSLK